MPEGGRLVFLNALPLNAISLKSFCITVRRIDLSNPTEVSIFLKQSSNMVSFIRHEATIEVLNRLLGLSLKPSSELYQWREGDELVIVTLRKPVRGQEIQDVKLEDLEVFYAYVSRGCV
jgi:hypothetical protein